MVVSNTYFSVDLRIFTDNDQIFISLRDYFNYFDPTEYYKKVNDRSIAEKNGIKIVMELAKEVRYVSTFNSNNIMILV